MRHILLVASVLAFGLLVGAPLVASRAQDEPSGTWTLSRSAGSIKGFADKSSAAQGELVRLYVTTLSPTFSIELYRLGWYDEGASQARLITRIAGAPGFSQPPPTIESDTGLISAANWTSNAQITIEDWPTGLYLFKLAAADGDQSYIPLVIRDDTRPHDFLFQHADTTDQAYNGWGGKSLYDFNSSGATTVSGRRTAVKVSFDRPLDGDGSGRSLTWELNMVRWLEANGFDVGYASDIDVHRNPDFDRCCRAILQAGHSEYWSTEMRNHLEAARDRGKGLGFFTGDTGSWAIRLEPSPLGADRVQVFYGSASLDPLTPTDPARATTHWYEPPLNRPVHQLLGIGSNAAVRRSADWVVGGVDAAPDLFASTGLNNGDVVRNLIGYEYDGLWTPGSSGQRPPGTAVLGSGLVEPLRPIESLTTFAVRAEIDAARQPPLGRLTTTINPGQNWSLYVRVRSPAGTWWLQYVPGDGGPGQYEAGGASYVRIPLGAAFTRPGWRPLDRDLHADLGQAIGTVPDGLLVDNVTLRGVLSLGPLSVVPADSPPLTMSLDGVEQAADGGWRIAGGTGQMRIDRTPDGRAALTLVPEIPAQRVDEAHTVVRTTPSGSRVVAVGTIQWSWALDGFGQHTDPEGNVTPVDERLQALTRNLLAALRGAE